MPPPHVVKITRNVLLSRIAVCSTPLRVTDPGANVSFGVNTASEVELFSLDSVASAPTLFSLPTDFAWGLGG